MIVNEKTVKGMEIERTTAKQYRDRDDRPQTQTTEVYVLHGAGEGTVVRFQLPKRKSWKHVKPENDFPPYMHIKVGSTDVHNFAFDQEGNEQYLHVDNEDEDYFLGIVEIKARIVTSTGGAHTNVFIYANLQPADEDAKATHEMRIKCLDNPDSAANLSWFARNFKVNTQIELLEL